MKLKRILSVAIATSLLLMGITVPTVSAENTLQPFSDGDTVMFFGDSITHYGLHVQYIQEAYASRYPNRNIKFVNGGISGDSLGYALTRVESYIDKWNPTKIVIMYGMNDLGYSYLYYDGINIDDEVSARRAEKIDAYKSNASALVDK